MAGDRSPRRRRPGGARLRAVPLLAALAACLALGPATGRAEGFEERLGVCLGCHGASGHSERPGVPSLGGQPMLFVAMQLFFFREGRRPATEMAGIARGMTDDDLRGFSERISKLPPPPPAEAPPDAARYARGAELARQHRCLSCHGADLSGRDQVPRIAPQREDYVLRSLGEYKSGRRVGHGATMPEAVAPLSEADFADLAHFLAHFRP